MVLSFTGADASARWATFFMRRATRRSPRPPSAIKAGISTFSRTDSNIPSDISASQEFTAPLRDLSSEAVSNAAAGTRSSIEAEASLSDSLILSAISSRSSSSLSDSCRQLARANAVSRTRTPAHAPAIAASTSRGTACSAARRDGSAALHITTAPAPNSMAPYRQTLSLMLKGNLE